MGKTFTIIASLPGSRCPTKFTPRSDYSMLREPAKQPQTLQASVSVLNMKLHDRTIRKIEKEHGGTSTLWICLVTMPSASF